MDNKKSIELPDHIKKEPIETVKYSRTIHFKDGSLFVQRIDMETFLKDVKRLLEDYDKEGTFYGSLKSNVYQKADKILRTSKQ